MAAEDTGADLPAMLDRKQKNTLRLHGNRESMNLNSMILTNILSSPYFKEDLFQLKTFHEVVDEIYYRAEHLEPWEKNSRRLAGQVGMCGGVRGVAAGGIVSTPYCLLYKLFTLKLTRKQLHVMLDHPDSPYIRALGFMYIRYCLPPADFWEWMGPYISDDEEIDLKAGGGYKVTIGEMVRMLLTKLDWFGTLFPRIPVSLQKELEDKIREAKMTARLEGVGMAETGGEGEEEDGKRNAEVWSRARSPPERTERRRSRSPRRRSRERRRDNSKDRERGKERKRERSRDRERERRRSRSRERSHRRSRSRDRRNRNRSRERRRSRSRSREKRRSRSRDRRSRSRSRDKRRSRSRDRRSRSYSRERRRSRSRERRERKQRSRSKERTFHDRRSR